MIETATFGGGCFWCTEAIFKRLKGVTKVTPGYSGGNRENPSYDQVSAGVTGHAEAIQLEFDPSVISYETILEIFWHTHNPTTPNRQGADVGTQYRSAIFYHSSDQQKTAEASKIAIDESRTYETPVVTEILPFEKFYTAEEYHKDYYENNQNAPYCTFVIDPKIKKLLKLYGDKVKEEYLH